MSTSFKGIRGGTPSGEPLCPTCRMCMRTAGESASSVEVLCLGKPGEYQRLRYMAYECSQYDDARQPSKWDMEQIAWVLTTDVKTREIGFKPPDKHQTPDFSE